MTLTMSSQPPLLLQDLTAAVSTGRILPFVESSDLLSIRAVSVGCHRLVHGGRGYSASSGNTASASATAEKDDDNDDDGNNESENLWRQMLARDFGFSHNWDVRCGDPDGALKGEMHLRTFRDPEEDNSGRNTRCWAGDECTMKISEQACSKSDDGTGMLNQEPHQVQKAKLMRCTRCQTARYCDRSCQVAHSRQHKSDCKKWSSASDLPGKFVGSPFLCTSEEMVASTAYDSWKRWERLRLRFDREARRADIRLSYVESDAAAAPKADEAFRIIGPFFLRCAEIWRMVEKWCRNDRISGPVGHHVLNSLQPGRALPFTKTTLGYQPEEPHLRGEPIGLESLMALYAFYAGQDEGLRGASRTQLDLNSLIAGLLGSYSAYEFIASTRLSVPFCGDGERCTVAKSWTYHPCFDGYKKAFTLDLTTGGVYAPEVDGEEDEHGMQFASVRTAAPFSNITPGLSTDSIIVWLSEYANRLENGMYAVGKIRLSVASGLHAILLYPTLKGSATTIAIDASSGAPLATSRPSSRVSRCVTRGVEVVASAVHAYEFKDAFYSIRIRIVQPGEEGYLAPSERGFDSCQLRSRRWTLTSNDTGEAEHVTGEGVTGLYPLLLDHGGHSCYFGRDAASLVRRRSEDGNAEETFVYQSMTDVHARGGTMQGELQFVPGSIRQPTGPEFDVGVAPFPLPAFSDDDPFVY